LLVVIIVIGRMRFLFSLIGITASLRFHVLVALITIMLPPVVTSIITSMISFMLSTIFRIQISILILLHVFK